MIGLVSPLAILVAVAIGLGASPPCARAETIVVDTVDDELNADGDCSLREALQAANRNVAVDACPAGSDADTDDIVLSAATYTLTLPPVFEFPDTGSTGDLDVIDNVAAVDLIVTGAGAATTLIEACTVDQLTAPCPSGEGVEDRVFEIWAGATAVIRGVTMRHGTATGAGGGVVNYGTLTIENAVVAASRGANGGGIWNPGTLELVESSVVQNRAVGDGGGVYSSGTTLVLTRATVAGNQAGRGGGITVDAGTMAAVASTIAGNQSASSGGGLNLWFGTTTILTNSTVSGNTTNFNGGGIFGAGGGSVLTLSNCTVTDNRAVPSGSDGDGGGIYNSGATIVVRNTILAGNVDTTPGIGAVPDCAGTLVSEGFNLLGDPRGCAGLVDGANDDRVGTAEAPIDPMVGALAGNGGPTETHALLAGSPAVDAGDPAGCTDETGTLLVVDQTGEPRTADGDGDGMPRCDVGSFELGGGVAQSFAIRPTRGGNAGPFRIVFYGAGFADGATAALVRSGEPDIVAQEVVVTSGGAVLAAVFDLAGRALGQWDAVVTNPGSASQTSPAAFTVQEIVEPRLWADLVGPTAMRVGRPTTFHLLYGNRGNVDALGVPVVIGLPRDFAFEVDVVPPTGEPGDPAIDWSRVPATMGSPDLAGVQAISLLLPAVPAGFTSTLSVTVTAPLSAIGRAVEFPFAIGQPYVGSALDPQVAALLVSGARTYARRVLDVGISRTLIPEMEAYVAARIADVVRTDLGALVAGLPEPRAIPHLLIGLAAVYQSSGEGCSGGTDEDGDGLADEADPDCQPEDDEEEDEDGDDDEEDEECDPEEAENPWYADDDCDGEPDCKEGGFDTCAPAPCTKWPPTACGGTPPSPDLIASHDPNDKVGSLGGGDGRYVTGIDPLRYVVFFENLPNATAAAQEVVITDRLDPDTMDVSTLSLGPIAFGDRQVVPPPGLSSFQTDVDLRPGDDLILRIAAALDPGTSVLTWRFTSLDPATGEPTTDPFAGFLPPNLTPPEGQGSVLFTVDSRDGLATGTEIRNGASIVFDVNEPIVTPEWLNTIDAEAPASQVTAAGGGPCSQALSVTWVGTDAGAGVQSYDVLVSESGGPFTAWLAGAAETGGTFQGKWGASYGFASVARDGAGNVEAAPTAPDVSASVQDCGPFNLAVTKIRGPKRVKLSRKKPVATVRAKVQIQNRSPTAQTIPSLQTLRELLALDLASLGGCPAPDPVLLSGKPQKKRPITIPPKRKLNVAFEITIGCANDGLKSSGRNPGHDDYTVSARVHQSVLGGADAFPDDDACPRIVASPGVRVPFPNGKIVDKGCGTRRRDRTLGDPVVVDVVDKR